MVKSSGRVFVLIVAVFGIIPSVGPAQDVSSGLNTAVKGSPERKAIMDALREGDKNNFDKPVIYKELFEGPRWLGMDGRNTDG
jgi:hypothetical protein